MMQVAFGSQLSYANNKVLEFSTKLSLSGTSHIYPTETRPLSSHVLENKQNRTNASRSWMGMYEKKSNTVHMAFRKVQGHSLNRPNLIENLIRILVTLYN